MDTQRANTEGKKMYKDCETCGTHGEIIDTRFEPPISTCPDCDGNGYVECDANEADADERANENEYCDDRMADIAAGEHFAARGY